MKRSIDLCINIVSVFFSISNFSQFHPVIMDNQVCDIKSPIPSRGATKQYIDDSPPPLLQIGALTMDLIDLEIKRTEHRAAEEGISPAMVAQKALDASTGQVQLQDRWDEMESAASCIEQIPCGLLNCYFSDLPTVREKKLLALIQKQDRLLYLCFYLLLNLAEDVGVEKKMKKKVISP